LTKLDTKRRLLKWEKAFLTKYRNTCNVRAACEAANISRQAVYQHKDTCPEFAALWEQARQEAIDILEARAWKRTEQGSDGMIQFLLKAHRREVYGDVTRNELTGKDGERLSISLVEVVRSDRGSSNE
jgi:hypothetical protein